jgi:cysteinyl-tRNA synthetase
MSLQLFNTLSRSVEPFEPLSPGRVSFYTCGPTVYNFAHIGNFRTFLFQDLLRRWLERSGFEVLHIMNLTDVDDKVIKAAGSAGARLQDYVVQYIDAFHEDRRYLRIRDASIYPRATEFIAPMIALVQSLLDKGIAYRSDDGSVYFAISRFPAYGRLSRLDTRELKAGASERVSADEYAKEDARDFVLWKAARPEDEAVGAAWDTPFGRGRPGWHLECSAMALDILGREWQEEVLDVHAGGVDLIFPHHEDEIAQSCAHTGEELFARVWMHGEFMTMSGTKMSKRFGNFLTARDLREEGVDAGTVRLLVFNTHYRQPLDWSDESLAHAREGSRRLGETRDRLREAAANGGEESAEFAAAAADCQTAFGEALNDDLNGPRALAALFVFAREANRLLDEGRTPGRGALSVLELAEAVLDVMPTGSAKLSAADGAEVKELEPVPPADAAAADRWAVAWARRRTEAKASRQYAEADRIRELLRQHGYEVRDTREGSDVVRSGPARG